MTEAGVVILVVVALFWLALEVFSGWLGNGGKSSEGENSTEEPSLNSSSKERPLKPPLGIWKDELQYPQNEWPPEKPNELL